MDSTRAAALFGAAFGAALALAAVRALRRERSDAARATRFQKSPKRLILVRHGESQGNVDHTIYRTVADNALHLTEAGWKQALSAGRAMRDIVGDESVYFHVSPYVRTRETFHAIAKAWGGHDCVRWKEDPRIREQDFGNFQNPTETTQQKKESKQFSKFYYRFPDGGESSADVYDRVSSFLETLYRHWEEHPEVENEVIVAHGLTIAVFFMRWSKYSVDKFNKYENFTNCEFAVLEKDARGKLRLQYVIKNETGAPVRQSERSTKPEHEVLLREMRTE